MEDRDFWRGVVYALEYVYEELDNETIFDTELAKRAKDVLGKEYYQNQMVE
jgi:hypothetical protein